MGSIPVRVTNTQKAPQSWCFSFFCVLGTRTLIEHSAHKAISSLFLFVKICNPFDYKSIPARYGGESQPRRLLWRPCQTRLIPVRVCRSGCFFLSGQFVFQNLCSILRAGNIPPKAVCTKKAPLVSAYLFFRASHDLEPAHIQLKCFFSQYAFLL